MKRPLKTKLFGFGHKQDPTAANEPRANRTIGITEQRLRARNQQSWMTSAKGWSDFFGRFKRSA